MMSAYEARWGSPDLNDPAPFERSLERSEQVFDDVFHGDRLRHGVDPARRQHDGQLLHQGPDRLEGQAPRSDDDGGHGMNQIVGGGDPPHGRRQRFRFEQVSSGHLGRGRDLRSEHFRTPDQAPNRKGVGFEPAKQAAADVSGGPGEQNLLPWTDPSCGLCPLHISIFLNLGGVLSTNVGIEVGGDFPPFVKGESTPSGRPRSGRYAPFAGPPAGGRLFAGHRPPGPFSARSPFGTGWTPRGPHPRAPAAAAHGRSLEWTSARIGIKRHGAVSHDSDRTGSGLATWRRPPPADGPQRIAGPGHGRDPARAGHRTWPG